MVVDGGKVRVVVSGGRVRVIVRSRAWTVLFSPKVSFEKKKQKKLEQRKERTEQK